MTRSPQPFAQSWKKMKEKTSSGELHFGHFRSGGTHNLINMVNYVMAEFPFRTGYSPKRWKNATDVMIKKAGLYDVEKLRTIVLFEADFNHNNKFLGREITKHAIPQRKVAKEQYSMPGKKRIDHVLNRRLIFDKTRYTKRSLAMTSCDLKSCYDRIVHEVVILSLIRAGIPLNTAISMFQTLQDCQHSIRIAFSDSEDTYRGKETPCIYPLKV